MSNQEIKGNLARLLATENLVVEHRKVPTASFDVENRVLTLPNWDRASNVVYDMLVGHEVGHALFTPNEDWKVVSDCPRDYVNIVEDARIEKLMKRKYPGLRKSFAGGYKELNDQDFFGIKEDDLSTYSLIDRINLHFKVGASALIPFEDDEMVFVKRTEDAETFEEVCQIALDVYNFCKQDKEQEKIDANFDANQTSSGAGGGMNSSEGEKEIGDDGDDNANENTNEEENANEDGFVGNKPQEERGGGEHADTEKSKTQDAFEDAAKKLTNTWCSDVTYVEIPDSVNIEDYVADWEEVHDWIDQYNKSTPKEYYVEVDAEYRQFRKQSQKEVNYLVKEFECRKSADAYARAGQSKTGVLDTAKLHTYQYNEDIFKKVTVLPDGKNHGLLFLLDWSGSMARDIFATVKQILNLTAFCKKVQIPFEVYAFTNDYRVVRRALGKDDYPYADEYGYNVRECEDRKIYLQKNDFHLMNLISSRSNSKNYERMCLNVFREVYRMMYHTYYNGTAGLDLSGTPLNEGIIMLNYLIPEFKKQNDLQKVNVCILTDGEACNSAYGTKIYSQRDDQYYTRIRRLENNVCLRDRQTGRVYSKFEGYEKNTNTFIEQLKDRNLDVNIIGFRIMGSSGLSAFVRSYADITKYDQVQKQWKKEKSAIVPNPISYTALYVINNTSLDDDVEFEVNSGAKKTEITKAFKKMLGSKSTNKKLLNSFVDYVA